MLSISFALFSDTAQARNRKYESKPNKMEELQQKIKKLEDSLNPNLSRDDEIAIRKELGDLYPDLIVMQKQWLNHLASADQSFRNQLSIDAAGAELQNNIDKRQKNDDKLISLRAGTISPNGDRSTSLSRTETEKEKTSLSGIVKGNDGKPLQNVLVLLSKDGQLYSYHTNPEGRFSFPDLPKGEYKVTIEHKGYDKWELPRLDYDPGKTGSPWIILSPSSLNAATISGKITLSDPPKDAKDAPEIVITLLSEELQNPNVKASPNGEFSLKPVPPGKYKIKIEAKGYGSTTQSLDATIKLSHNLIVNLEKNTGDVSVFIIDKATGSSICGAQVKLLKHNATANDDTEVTSYVKTEADGVTRFSNVDAAYRYKVAVTKNGYLPYVQSDDFSPSTKQYIYAELSPLGGGHYRAVIGFEQAGASSTQGKQNLFLDFFFSRPLIHKNWDDMENLASTPPRLSVWGDVRLTSTPQQSQNIVKAFDVASFSSSANVGDGQTKLISAASFMAGLQVRVTGGYIGGKWIDFSLIGGGGALTPLFPEQPFDSFIIPKLDTDKVRHEKLVEQLKLVDSNFNEGDLDGKDIITFVPKDRNRFLKNYFYGVRFQTYYNDVAPTRPPATLDVTFGGDEAIMGGKFGHTVFRIDGFFPLPMNSRSIVYLFGTASMAFTRPTVKDQLLLPGANGTIGPTNEKAFVFSVPLASRDVFRIGIGFNLLEVFGNRSNPK